MEVCVEPTVSIATSSEVVCLEFSPFEWSKDLLAVTLPKAINIYSFKCQEETESGKAEYRLLCQSQVEGECAAIAWSPHSSLHATPPFLKLLLATSDDAVIEFTTDLSKTAVKELFRHSGAINSVACSGLSVGEGSFPSLCASVGDDQLLRVWTDHRNTEESISSEAIMLMEPGQIVRFNLENPHLLLVGEVSGTIRIYRISQSPDNPPQPLLTAEWSVQCPSPMLDADWSSCNPELLLAAGAFGVNIINMDSNGSTQCRSVSSRGAVCVRGSRSSAALVAALTVDKSVIVLYAHSPRIPLAAHLQATCGLGWHSELPYLAVGADRRVLLWRVDTN